MLPLPWACMARTSCFMLRTTPSTLVSNVAAKLSAVCSVIGPPAPSVPALFTATSRRPNRATVSSTILRTSSSWRTSALMNSASEPKARSSLTSALPASSRRPATTTFAPFLAKATAAARPMPVSPPVINTTGLPCSSPRLIRFELPPDVSATAFSVGIVRADAPVIRAGRAATSTAAETHVFRSIGPRRVSRWDKL